MHILPDSTHAPLQNATVLALEYAVALKPWFSRKIIEDGFRLLQDGHVLHFSFMRRYGGLVLDDSLLATVHMARGKGVHRYVVRDGQCSQCVSRQGGSRCKHIAALALLCLRKEDGQLKPITDIFSGSPWAVIGRYLYTRSEMTPITLNLGKKGGLLVLSGGDDCGLTFHVALSQEAADEILCLHSLTVSAESTQSTDISQCSDLRQLQNLLADLTTAPNERILNQHGSKSKQQHIDVSLWMHLARLLFLHVPADQFSISRNKEGAFRIQAPQGKNPLFKLIPSRLHTWEILSQLELEIQGCTTQQQTATRFSKVQFSEDGQSLRVEQYCRLDDGREFSLAELASCCYGTRYLRDNHFFSLKSIPAEKCLKTQEKQQLSLFALAEKKPAATRSGFTVPAEDLKDFLRLNHTQLRCGIHRVADEVLNLHFVDMPTQLVLESYDEHDDWCYLAGWYDLGNRQISLADLLDAAVQKKTLLPGASWMQIDDSPLAWFHHLGSDRIIERNGDNDKWIKLRRSELVALGTQIGQVRNKNPENTRGILSFLESTGIPESSAITKKMPSHLRTYQCHGTAWLYHLQQHGLGAILADDMGLGKTHQALALIDLMADSDERFLIVCPASVLYHWPEKQQKFFPHLKLSLHHGPQRDLDSALTSRVIVTTYGVLRSDAGLLSKIPFKLVIFDEMQYLKNRSTATYQAAIRLNADSVIGLTGTPVENRIEDLETLLSICLPDLLEIAGIRQRFHTASTPEARQKLQKMISPFILRRTRKQVLPELPRLSEDIRLCELSPDQVAAYRQAVDQVKGTVDDLLENKIQDNYTHILTIIIRLKQICNHLCLLQNCTDWNRYESGKWNEFTTLIKECLEADLKIVVFSQFTSMLDIIEAWLTAEQIDFVALRGSVEAQIRSKRITRFNTVKTCRVFSASLLAGGTGIDLTGAQVVIHFDRWWNPAKEEQATARVHRMGQRHPVQVYKLITIGTLEEKIHHLIEQKRTLAANLITEDDGSILKQLNRKELAGLFEFSS